MAGWLSETLRGSLRVTRDPPSSATRNLSRLETSESGRAESVPANPEPYFESLVKLFPVEAVTLYPLAIGVAGDEAGWRYALLALICVFIVALRYLSTKPEEGGSPDWPAIGVAIVSFLLYAGSLGGFGNIVANDPERTAMLMSFLTVMWVALVPMIIRRLARP